MHERCQAPGARHRVPGTVVLLYLFFIYLSPVQAAFREEDAGTASAQFLKLGAGAQSQALGGAYGSIAKDASAIYWNPAGLALIPKKSITLMHATYVESIFYDFASYSIPLAQKVGLGVSVQYLSVGAIEETSNEGLTLGEYKPENLALSFGSAYHWKDWALGASVKYIRMKIRDSASTLTMDVGLMYRYHFLTIGAVGQNLFGDITFERSPNPLVLNYKLALSLTLPQNILITTDLNAPKDNQVEYAAGLEKAFLLNKEWAIIPRGGYSTRIQDLSGLKNVSAGLGFETKLFSIDYAWVPLGEFGTTHRISLTFWW